MSDLTHLLFWIDQEPVESEVEIYLPADTPIQRPSAKVLHQMQKARQIKHNRETRRLKTVYYERLKAIKRDLAKGVQRHLLPKFPSTPSKIDILSGTEFINQNQKQIVELLNFARSVKTNQIEPSQTEKTNKEMKDHIKQLQAQKEYQHSLEEGYNTKVNEMDEEYNQIMADISKRYKEKWQHEEEGIHTSPTPPLPPRVSQHNPRTFLPEYRTQT